MKTASCFRSRHVDAAPGPRIWQLNLDELDDDPSLLSAAERERASRFVRPSHARRYVQAHCALRRIVAAAVETAPERLAFLTTETGKPTLPSTSGFDFSLSHSGPLALIATSDTRRVGVDIERRRHIADLKGVAGYIMSERERHAFETAHPHQQRRVFFDLWTRKEALLKATGRGFLDDPRTLELDVNGDVASVLFAQTRWTVAQLNAGADAAAAVAIEDVANEGVATDVLNYGRPA
jgi:4'-phosphopantetheinyl transferase